MKYGQVAFLGVLVCACGSSSPDQGGDAGDAGPGSDVSQPDGATGNDAGNDSGGDGSMGAGKKVVFVIPLENEGQTAIYGDTTDAPYINNTLMQTYAYTMNFTDELPSLPSEPHYVYMEAGANKFSDTTFTTDNDPSASNSTSSTAHLATQMNAAGVTWTSYQEGITAGTCPIASITSQFYAAKHDPFVFFQDIVGSPPAATTAGCIAHHKPLNDLAADLMGTMAQYNFITPNLCHDMHGDAACPQGTSVPMNIAAGDTWLKTNLQPIIDYAFAHDGYVFITFDQGTKSSTLIPFIAISKNAIPKHAGTVSYTHSSMLKSEEEILGLPILSTVASANDLADLFTAGTFP